jgi:septal ring factor EnvC (AmiA/AmiB activator)
VGSDGKDAIALRDELVELKKSLNSVTRERDLTQARYAKLEQALAKKDREIEDLLASGHITVSSAHEYLP